MRGLKNQRAILLTVPTLGAHAINALGSVTDITVTLSSIQAGVSVYVALFTGSVLGPSFPAQLTDSAGNTYARYQDGLLSDTYGYALYNVDDAKAGTDVVITASLGGTYDAVIQATAINGTTTPSLDATGLLLSYSGNPYTLDYTPATPPALLLAYMFSSPGGTYTVNLPTNLLDQEQTPGATLSLGVGFLEVDSGTGSPSMNATSSSTALGVQGVDGPYVPPPPPPVPTPTPGPAFPPIVDQPCVAGPPAPIAQLAAGPTVAVPFGSVNPARSYYDRCLEEYVSIVP